MSEVKTRRMNLLNSDKFKILSVEHIGSDIEIIEVVRDLPGIGVYLYSIVRQNGEVKTTNSKLMQNVVFAEIVKDGDDGEPVKIPVLNICKMPNTLRV